MEQVLICLKQHNSISLAILNEKQKELVALGTCLKSGKTKHLASHVKQALDAGATEKDILDVITFILGDRKMLHSIIELLSALSFEQAMRKEYISVCDDCRE